jgi:hypothetical protein
MEMGRRALGGIAGALLVASWLPACTLLTDLDGLSVGDASANVDSATDDQRTESDGAADVADARDEDATTPDPLSFTDDFNRDDSSTIGNAWVMKYAPAFQLLGQGAQRLFPDSNHDFVDNIVYRPTSESLSNVEVSVEVHFSGASIGYAQIHARVQPSTLGTSGQLDSYMLFTNASSTTAVIARQHGGSSAFTGIGNIMIAPALNATDTFRLRLRVTGASDVTVHGYVERRSGTNTWDVIGEASTLDTSVDKITTAGTVGFSGGRPESAGIYTYDNFTRTPL